ncbi:hypothetical protein N7468_010134 [Penicillium chermesinum]|uniref:Mediator of RNA polymerase II transcription subunit 1 n=1 Tax=Penicillium chermesinum TaxID=63820 RepID=A0A9W9NC39_9EURO|nr:uncharacterized protein N7468_010134 [Penicillium chermesinum]KAJ5217126.1 hypothetical protein N7468_010134 [Penicillium chermesinum]
MATPSAKPGATPTHLTSSPHPGSAPLSRSIAHKSPSTRTPTGYGAGHHNHASVSSSHQYATPLAVSSGVDDPVNFSSPSALLALGAYTGISPGVAVHDGLVGTSMNDTDIQNLGMQGLKLGRDSDEEQRHRIEEVVQVLRARVAGRGVSREGVERLSRLEGFESIWQHNDINIAGNFVDLEIEFHAGHEVVKDVSLRYATPEYTEGERREEATSVLKRNLVQSPQDADTGKWRSLQAFYENLQWLAKLDKLSQEVNCFEALEGLEENVKRIWEEENKDNKYGGAYEHLCRGVIGRPSMHKGSRIGLGLEYWVDQAMAIDKKKNSSPDAMVLDNQEEQEASDLEDERRVWTAMIECEEGYPSLRISKEWVGTEVFSTVEKTEDSDSAEPSQSVNWLEPPQTMRISHGNHPDPMALDSSMLESSPPNRRFVLKLEPALDLPIFVVSEIYRHLGLQQHQEFKFITYDTLLVSGPMDDAPLPGQRKCRVSVDTFEADGTFRKKHHNCSFQPFEAVSGRTISELPFSHPRQIAEIIPTFRQYAMLSSLIRRVFKAPAEERASEHGSSANPQVTSPGSVDQASDAPPDHTGIITLSNDESTDDKIAVLLAGGFPSSDSDAETLSLSSGVKSLHLDDVKVDVTLRTQIGQAPALILVISEPGRTTSDTEEITTDEVNITICIEIGLNGRVTVTESAGLAAHTPGGGDTEMQGADDSDPTLQDVHRKIARVLEISQDLGILVEWVLRSQRQRAGGG